MLYGNYRYKSLENWRERMRTEFIFLRDLFSLFSVYGENAGRRLSRLQLTEQYPSFRQGAYSASHLSFLRLLNFPWYVLSSDTSPDPS